MRNVIAALVAVAAVGAVVWFGWSELSVRTGPAPVGPSATDVLTDFVAAYNTGDAVAMTELVHPDDRVGLDGLLAADEAMRTDLQLADATISLGDVEEGADRASAATTVTVTLDDLPDAGGNADPAEAGDDVGSIGWLGALRAIERRSGWFVQPDRSVLHPSLTGTTRFARREVETPRASILAADGSPLTVHGDLETLGIEPGQIRDADVLRTRWAEVLPQSQPQLEAVLARDDLVDDWFYAVVSLPSSEVEAAWSRLRTLPSVIRKTGEDASATATSTTASHVLGSVGAPGAGLAEELGVAPDDVVGLSGLERVFEDRLVGSATVEVVLETSEGTLVEELGVSQVDPSEPVTTSLDATLQASVEAALLGVDDPAAVVGVTTDGGVAAIASRPLTGYNRAMEGAYPPGDLFMPITAAALIRDGRDLGTRVACPATAVRAGAEGRAPQPLRGEVSMGTALAAGCDSSIVLLAEDLPPEDLVGMADDFGWDDEPDLPLSTSTPTFPTPVDTTETIRAALGQARVQASPLHLATVAAEVLSGNRLTPWLIGDEATQPGRIPVDTTGLLRVFQQAAVDGSGATITDRAVGIIVGTAPVTGSDTIHSWAMMLVDDVGLVVLVEDTAGNLDQVRRIARRIEGELVGRGAAATSTPPPTPQPTTPDPTTPTPAAPVPTTPTGGPDS